MTKVKLSPPKLMNGRYHAAATVSLPTGDVEVQVSVSKAMGDALASKAKNAKGALALRRLAEHVEIAGVGGDEIGAVVPALAAERLAASAHRLHGALPAEDRFVKLYREARAQKPAAVAALFELKARADKREPSAMAALELLYKLSILDRARTAAEMGHEGARRAIERARRKASAGHLPAIKATSLVKALAAPPERRPEAVHVNLDPAIVNAKGAPRVSPGRITLDLQRAAALRASRNIAARALALHGRAA